MTSANGAEHLVTRRLLQFFRSREIGIFAAFAMVVAVTTLKSPPFMLSADGWRDLLLAPSILLVLAVGQSFVIITRSVDLSVSSILGLTAWLIGVLYINWPTMPVPVAFVLGTAFGCLLGLVNGAVIAIAKVPGMVITLGTLYAFRGVNVMWAGSKRINATNLGDQFLALGTTSVLGVPVLTIIALIVLAGSAWYLRNMRGGRELYAIGSDVDAAELYGLPTRKRVLMAFVVSGAMAGLAGVLFASRYGTIASNAGSGYELQAIGAAVIGGVAIVGGSGTVIGAALGAYLLATIYRSLPVLGIADFWQGAVVGTLILAAIIFDRNLAARRSRRLVAERMS
jgi:rhamnose transport system permease protein